MDDPDYAKVVEECRAIASELRGRRILQVNATARGGGVAELLRSAVPFLQRLGLDAEWRAIGGPQEFYETTKRIHNALQGAPHPPSEAEWQIFERVNLEAANELDPDAWDVIVAHDPQPAAMRTFLGPRTGAVWVWRCHIDTSHPDATTRAHFVRYLEPYEATVFSLPHYAMDGLGQLQRHILPGIDPLSPKNQPMDVEEAREIVRSFGVDTGRPLVAQISRFDVWKDPLGVLEAFKEAKAKVPNLQLALVGSSADDDPESSHVLDQAREAAKDVADVLILADEASDRDVNAFQTAATVVVQKSIREGFGLTVSEAMWSGTPVIGGAAGGIPHQIEDGRTGYLVSSPTECARRIVELVRDPAKTRRMGEAARQSVGRHFLLQRMVRDELRLWRDLTVGNQARR